MTSERGDIQRNIDSLMKVIHGDEDSRESVTEDRRKRPSGGKQPSGGMPTTSSQQSLPADEEIALSSSPTDKQTSSGTIKRNLSRQKSICLPEDSIVEDHEEVEETTPDEPTDTTPLLGRSDKRSEGRSCKKMCAAQLGLVYALMSAFFSSVVNALVKGLTNVDPAALSMFRFAFILIPSGFVAYRRRSIFPKGYRWTLIFRATTGTLGLICKFYALRFMPLADASVIILSAPIFVAIFARICLKEAFTWVNALTVACTIGGILLIIQPPFLFGGAAAHYHIAGPILAISSNLLASNSYIQLRQLRDVHSSVTMSIFCIMAVPMSAATWIAVSGGHPTLPTDYISWLLILGMSVFSYVVQLCFTMACQVEKAGPVSVVRTTDIIFAVVWQVVFFHEIPGLFSWIGMLLIIGAVLTLAVYKWYKTHHKERQEKQEQAENETKTSA